MNKLSKEKLLAWAYSVLCEKANEGFFGTVVVSIQNGRVSHVKTEHVEKPPQGFDNSQGAAIGY